MEKFYNLGARKKNEPQCQKMYLRIYAPNEDSDHPEHSLGAFWIAKTATFLRADNDDSDQTARTDLSLRLAHMSEGTFSHFAAQIIMKDITSEVVTHLQDKLIMPLLRSGIRHIVLPSFIRPCVCQSVRICPTHFILLLV